MVKAGGWRTAVVVLGLLAATGTGCAGASRTAEPPSARFAVGTRTEKLVDLTRTTDLRSDYGGEPSRTLETLVYYPAAGKPGGEPAPDAAAAAAGGGFPLVVFSHGSGVASPLRYDLLFRSWASAGYVVAAPKHPLSSTPAPDGGADVVNQPGDVTFVITELLNRSADTRSPYGGLLDPGRIAVAGHSLGGITALGAAFNRCCADPRIRAGIVMAGRAAAFPADGWFPRPGTPILVVHGDDDRLVRLAEGQKIFHDAPPPKAMLTVFGGDHNRPFGGALATQDNPERLGATLNGPTSIVNTTVIAFLDRYLKDRTDAFVRLGRVLVDEVTVRFDLVE